MDRGSRRQATGSRCNGGGDQHMHDVLRPHARPVPRACVRADVDADAGAGGGGGGASARASAMRAVCTARPSNIPRWYENNDRQGRPPAFRRNRGEQGTTGSLKRKKRRGKHEASSEMGSIRANRCTPYRPPHARGRPRPGAVSLTGLARWLAGCIRPLRLLRPLRSSQSRPRIWASDDE